MVYDRSFNLVGVLLFENDVVLFKFFLLVDTGAVNVLFLKLRLFLSSAGALLWKVRCLCESFGDEIGAGDNHLWIAEPASFLVVVYYHGLIA